MHIVDENKSYTFNLNAGRGEEEKLWQTEKLFWCCVAIVDGRRLRWEV